MAIEDHGLRPEFIETDLGQIPFSDPRLPGVGNLYDAIVALVTGMYPNYKGTVTTPASLPGTATDGDYYIVTDDLADGSNIQAGYVWETRDSVSAWQKKYSWNTQGILADLKGQVDPEYATLLGKAGSQRLAGGNQINENLELEANSFDDSGNIIVHNTVIPKDDAQENLGDRFNRFVDIYFSGDLSDGALTATISNIVDAYNHSQVNSGNPHNTNYEDLGGRIGTLTVSGDVSTQIINLSTGGNKTLAITITDDSHNHTTATISDFVDATWALLKARLVHTSEAIWTFNDATKEASLDIAVDTNSISDIATPEANKILVGKNDGSEWIKSDGAVELTGDISGTGTYNSTNDKTQIVATVENVPLDKVDKIKLDNMAITTIPGNPTQLTFPNHNLVDGRKIRLFGTTIDGEYVIAVVDANTISIPVDTTAGLIQNGYIIPNGSQLMWNSTDQLWEVKLEFSNISHYEVQDKHLDDHTQYALLDGRGSSQVLSGGELANGTLILQSTSDRANVGDILLRDRVSPENGAVYTTQWDGTDIGSVSRPFRDLYVRGELKGARFEQVTSLPIATIQDKGRSVQMPDGKLYINEDGSKYTQLMKLPDLVGRSGKALVVNQTEDGFTFEDIMTISSDSLPGEETGIGSGSAVTISAPANAIGIQLQADEDNTHSIRYAWGSGTPTPTAGYELLPSDTVDLDISADLKVIAEGGVANKVSYTWKIK